MPCFIEMILTENVYFILQNDTKNKIKLVHVKNKNKKRLKMYNLMYFNSEMWFFIITIRKIKLFCYENFHEFTKMNRAQNYDDC